MKTIFQAKFSPEQLHFSIFCYGHITTLSRERLYFHTESLCCVLLALTAGRTKLLILTRKVIRHRMFPALSLWRKQYNPLNNRRW